MASGSQEPKTSAHVYDAVYEHERGGLFGGWSAEELTSTDPSNFTDEHGSPATLDEFVLERGWEWDGNWRVEIDPPATDDQGWQVCWMSRPAWWWTHLLG